MFEKLRNLFRSATGPVPPARPTGLSRRDFLRAIGVTSTTVAMGGMTGSLWKPDGLFVPQQPGGLVKPQGQMLEFYAYQTAGASLGNTAALLKADFDEPWLTSRKELCDAVNEFTREKMREEGFLRKIMPVIGVTNDQLDREIAELKGHDQWLHDNGWAVQLASGLVLPSKKV